MSLHRIYSFLRCVFAFALLLFSSRLRADSITFQPWTGDAGSGISSDTLWAYHFGGSTSTTVNGVVMPGVAGINPAVAGKFSITGVNGIITNDSNDLTALAGQGSAVAGRSFVYNGTPAVVAISGLTMGVSYTASFFSAGWDAPVHLRENAFSWPGVSWAPGASAVVNQQVYGADKGIRVDCTFTATAETHEITVTPQAGATWHHYALALRVQSAHRAYVFKTDADPLPAEWTAAINAYGGPGTAIIIIGPAGGLINGAPVLDQGDVTLQRYDFSPGVPQGAPPQARHFIIAGDLNLSSRESIWGYGAKLLKLEVLNNATLQPGSLISVAAQGWAAGAGGGDGGVAAPHPSGIYRSGEWTNYVRGAGGTATSGTGKKGPTGRAVISQTENFFWPFTPINRQPRDYIPSISGEAGGIGQGDGFAYLTTVPGPGGVPVSQYAASASPGGQGLPYDSAMYVLSPDNYPVGGEGGEGGAMGFSSPVPSSGFNGRDGEPGSNGWDGRDGGHGGMMTLGGTVAHLRGGSGGGAGATGGFGQGGASGGGGGGGGASGYNVDETFPEHRAGGAGGLPGLAGLPGVSGIGGNGGGGGGGILLIARGSLLNSGTILASGGNGIPGQQGTPGTPGSEGGAGAEGTRGPGGGGLKGGDGGKGGRGGNGGRGGHGGNGASGSGGTIQLAAGNYQAFSPVFNVSGGTGAPAGRVQIHGFNNVAQNAPFGAFAAGLSSYRSYTYSTNLLPFVQINPALVPYLPLEGGAAVSGLGSQNFVSDAMITALQPPVHAAAAVVRLPSGAFFSDYAGYDLIVFTPLKSGYAINGPKLSLINGGDVHESTIGGGWTPGGPQWLTYNTGDAANPAFVPGASGPATGPIPWNRGFMTLVETGKPFTVTAQYGPYNFLRSFTGEPVLASLSPANYLGSSVLLYDKGLMRSRVVGRNITNFNVVISESESETEAAVAGETFYRVGVPPSVAFTATNIGNAWSRGAGSYSIRYTPTGGSETTLSTNYGNAVPGTPVFSQTITAAASTTANTQAFIGEFTLLPDYDLGGPQPIAHTITANVLGPQSTFSGLTGTAFGPGVHFSTGALSAVTQSIQLTNTAPVRTEWLTFANANPEFTRLGIVPASFVGANASAFSVTAPSTLERNASGNVSITFTPPGAGSFSATLRIVTDEGVNNGVAGRTIDIPVTAFVGFMETYETWALALPPALRDRNADADGNGIPNYMDYGLRGVPLPSIAPASGALNFTLPVADRSDVRWSITGSSDLQNWQPLAVRGTTGGWSLTNPADAISEVISGPNRQLSFTRSGGASRYFMRLTANQPDIAATYNNNFATEPRALLYGTAEWQNGSIRLTQADFDQMGSAILSGVEVWPSQTGFRAAFNLTTGPGSIPNPADGASFSVGQLPNNGWGEDGPETFESARNLTICFDTYGTSGGFEVQRGIRIRVNRDLVLYSPVNPYSNGAARAVEIIYTPAEGLTVKFNGSNVFTNVGLGTFALQPGDRFGFGGRTGGLNQVNRIDDVVIEPR